MVRSVVACVVALVLLLPQVLPSRLLSAGSPACAEASLSSATTCSYTIAWSMADRVADVARDSSKTRFGQLPTSDVYAPYAVRLGITARGNQPAVCTTRTVWKWSIFARPTHAKVVTKPAPGCRSVLRVSLQGRYRIAATMYVAGRARKTITTPVQVHDLLVVGLGDSNASGEGTPPFWFGQCDRGPASYQYQAARLLQSQSHERTSVTFTSVACSGARIEHIGTTDYSGINAGPELPPQLRQLQQSLTPPKGQPRRPISAALVSVGVNDIAFGSVMSYCVHYALAHSTQHNLPECQSSPVRQTTNHGFPTSFTSDPKSRLTIRTVVSRLLSELPGRYVSLAHALSASRLVAPSRVYLTQYPTFAFGAGGKVCSTATVSVLSPVATSTWSWLARVGSRLNRLVIAAAHRNGWRLIAVPSPLFYGHGYCARKSWFVSILQAAAEGDVAGAFHATTRGAHVSAVLALKQMCPLLGGARDCESFPKP